MPSEITMPQLSDTMSEGTLVKWLKKEGDKVKEGDAVAEVETDKAVMPMETFESGTLAAQMVKEGEKVKVGAVIALVAKEGEDVTAVKKGAGSASAAAGAPAANAGTQPASKPAKAAEGEQGSTASHSSATAVATAPSPAAPSGAGAAGHHAAGNNGGPASSNGGARIRVSPLASRVAADKGIDLSQVRGTGPNGRIHVRDVEEYTPSTPSASAKAETKGGGAGTPAPSFAAPRVSGSKEVIPLTKMRQVIAQRLQLSKQTIPHFYTTVDIDMEAAMALREKLNKQLEKEKIKLSVNDLVMKATAAALAAHPGANAHFKDTEIHRFADVNLGIAVALPDGLIVPVLRGVQNMGLKEIKLRTGDLVDRARAQKLKGDEMSGGTFTITNLGAWGVKEFGAIVNPPEVAILAVGAAEQRAVVRDGQVVARSTMSVTLSADHRALDGASAAEFCRTLKSLLEEPGLMLV